MADCTSACPGQTCVSGDDTIDATDSGGCTTLDLVISDSNTIDLSVASNRLEGTAIVDPADNVIVEPGNGLHVPQFVIGASSKEQSWTETSIGDNIQHTTQLLVPEGDWFIVAFWNAWIRKVNRNASEKGTETYWRLGINDSRSRLRHWRWDNTAGLLGSAQTQVAVGDHFPKRLRFEEATLIDITVMTGITSSRNEDNEVDYHSSILSVQAVREF